ncbi:MAG: PEP-CTERM sorting domain-containing protein [Chthoniobacterales bacterium]
MKQTPFSSLSLLTALAVSALALTPVTRAASITSTVSEDNGATSNGFDGNQDVYVGGPGVLTVAGGYNFGAVSLTSIAQITITLTLTDGNSGTGDPSVEFDRSHLFLALDGITINLGDPNSALNDFFGSTTNTHTFTFNIDGGTSAQLLAALGDGRLVGTVVTDNPNDTAPGAGRTGNPNEIFFGNANIPSDALTSLTLSDVPEPATTALIGLGLLLALAPQVRRFRKTS